MVAFNSFSKLCVVVALGLSATVTSTEVAQEQPKKESFVSRFFGKRDETATKRVEVQEKENSDSEEDIETGEPSNYSVEWYLLPKPLNRATLRYRLPRDLYDVVPLDCNKPIAPEVEKRIRNYFSLHTIEWYLLPKPLNRAALRYSLPSNLSKKVPEDCREPIKPEVEERIRKYFSLYAVDWYLLPKPENRATLRNSLPRDLASKVPEDCNQPIEPEVVERIREFFSLCSVEWYHLPKPENGKYRRSKLPWELSIAVPKDGNETILGAVEKRS
ncbi:SmORF protein [Babesia bovis T2Bo]|uniref:SmORF n=1 Tax=Babesia bovis TaxID=5865 RepID=A7AXD2_BABBO|nr:SmORF protein [Babesia bovis T2Bo]EDO05205.1 SmORF protein [Babesia bovis T2Bo]BAN64376.1 small open reading frame [Babesia bovis]|eukprot:XP_001608773.1 SmORF [Babesia bovis T2Bo]